VKVELIISKEAIRRVVNDFEDLADKKLREINLQSYKSANNIRNTAMDLVPVDTGRLKNDIRVEKESSNILPSNKGIVYKIFTNVVYAKYIEFGTPVGTGPHGGPRPYLRPAFMKEWPLYKAGIKKIWRSR